MQRKEFARVRNKVSVSEQAAKPATAMWLWAPLLVFAGAVLLFVAATLQSPEPVQSKLLSSYGRIDQVAANHRVAVARLRFYLSLVVCDDPGQDHQLDRLKIENGLFGPHQEYLLHLASVQKQEVPATFCSETLPKLREEFRVWVNHSNENKLVSREKPGFKFLISSDFAKQEIDRLLNLTRADPPPSPSGDLPTVGGDNIPLALSTAEPRFDPDGHCANRYPSDFNMRKVCARIQQEAHFTASSMQIDTDVGVICTRRYPEDWSMFVVCAKQQMSSKLPDTAKPDRPDFKISTKCQRQYPSDYKMQDYCVAQQEDARSEAGSRQIDDDIAKKCTSDYPTDWKMFVYCVGQQTKAKAALD